MNRRWVFWAVTALLTTVWVMAQLPYGTRHPENEYYLATVDYMAGRPLRVASWTVSESSGETYNSVTIPGNILINAAPLVALIALTWFLTRPEPGTGARR